MKVLFHCTDLLFILLPGDCPCECFCECPFRLFSVYLFTHICRYTSIFSYLNHTVYILHLDFFFLGGVNNRRSFHVSICIFTLFFVSAYSISWFADTMIYFINFLLWTFAYFKYWLLWTMLQWTFVYICLSVKCISIA